jgi:hypothetical protein
MEKDGQVSIDCGRRIQDTVAEMSRTALDICRKDEWQVPGIAND